MDEFDDYTSLCYAGLRSAKLSSSPNELSMTHAQHQIQLLKLFLAPVVKKVNNAMYWISLYPMKSAIGLPNSYPLNNDLSGEWRYPTFEQLGPGKDESCRFSFRGQPYSY